MRNYIFIFVLMSTFLTGCKTLAPIPENLTLNKNYISTKTTYPVIVNGVSSFDGMPSPYYDSGLASSMSAQYSVSHGLYGGLVAGLAAGLIAGAEQENYFKKMDYFLRPVINSYENRDLTKEVADTILPVLNNQSWVSTQLASPEQKVDGFLEQPHIVITSRRYFTDEFRGLFLLATVEIFNPNSQMDPSTKDFRLKPIFKKTVKYQTPLLEEPIKTQESIDSEVVKIKKEFENLTAKQKRNNYYRTLKNEKLSKARRSKFTQDERSDFLREQWLANDKQLLDDAILKVRQDIETAVKQGLSETNL